MGEGAPALPLHCQSITEIAEASVVAELAVWQHRKEGSRWPGRSLGPKGERGAPDHGWPSAELGLPLAPSAPSQALPPASVILGSPGCHEGGMSPLLAPWEICKTLQLPKGDCGFFFFPVFKRVKKGRKPHLLKFSLTYTYYFN